MTKKKVEQSSNFENVESALTKTEQFIEDNRKILTYIIIGLFLVVAAYLGFKRFYVAPLETEAKAGMFVAEQYFQKDSFNLAINGDGNNWGFLDVIDEYGLTKSANLARYYVGISYLNLGQYEEAISYLKKFKSKDMMVSVVAIGAIGDAYAELGQIDKAISYYKKASTKNPNDFTSPIYLKKEAQLYESKEDYKKAISIYEEIKAKYAESQEGKNIDKFIAKAKTLLEK